MEDHEAEEVGQSGLVGGAFAAWRAAKLTPWLVRIASYLTLTVLAGVYGWWVWRRARKLEAAGVEPPPAPPRHPPGPLPPARPPRW